MVYAKYLLWKTGLFPKWEPAIEDVLEAAIKAHDVKCIVTPNRRRYYYVIPDKYNVRYLRDLTRVFRRNGVILRPHKSWNYSSVVFRVPARDQQFMRDVMRVNKDTNSFQCILIERGIATSNTDIDEMLKRIRQKSR